MTKTALFFATFIAFSGLSVHAECRAPGLVGEYFAMDDLVSDFPVVSPDHFPTFKRVDRAIAFPWVKDEFYGTGLRERFYVRWSGYIKAPKSGRYTFYTESDDGSRLFIDGAEVVDNYGLHGMQEEEGDVYLKSGRHRIQVDFIQYDGGSGCICKWKTPVGEKETIPEYVFSHPSCEEDIFSRTAAAFEPHLKPHPQPPEPAENATLDERVASVLALPEEDRWMNVQWRRNLHAARMESQVQGKPIFLWVMNGNPAGCT